MKSYDKNNDTGLRILEILKILIQSDATKHDLIAKLCQNSKIENVHTQEAFIKYFNTLEASGFKINKENKIYKLENSFYKIELSNQEIDIISKLIKTINELYDSETKNDLFNVFKRLEKFTNANFSSIIETTKKEVNENYNYNFKKNIYNYFENLIKDEQLVKIKFKKEKQKEECITVEIKNVIEKNNLIYVVCYNPNWSRNKKININTIKEIEQLQQKTSNISNINPIIFEIYGRLANIYKLKSSEKVIDFNNNCITISNTEEDKDSLLLRLLKYGESCKIIRPKHIQEEFVSLTDSILKNLEVV